MNIETILTGIGGLILGLMPKIIDLFKNRNDNKTKLTEFQAQTELDERIYYTTRLMVLVDKYAARIEELEAKQLQFEKRLQEASERLNDASRRILELEKALAKEKNLVQTLKELIPPDLSQE